MRYGELNRALINALVDGTFEPTHRPDGLTEADIDALIVEAFGELDDFPADDTDEPTDLAEVIHMAAPATSAAHVTSEFEGEVA